jgi:flavin reductase (DIM6/NTAB) family NADH-FMN oxidoreductase RutF
MVTGAPIISGGVAFLDCRIIDTNEFGNNTIFFGEVLDSKYQEDLKPLLYSNRMYKTLHK